MKPLSFIWPRCYQRGLSAYPSTTDEPSLTADIHGIAPHRVYLISLQPNCTCFLLHWSFSNESEKTGVTRYAALWCPDFPPFHRKSDKATCSYKNRKL